MERSDLELILAIRDLGTLAGAARRLDVAPPAVTKRLAALEAHLGSASCFSARRAESVPPLRAKRLVRVQKSCCRAFLL